MIHILSGDLLIADVITELKDNPQLAALAEKYGMQPGGKQTLTAQQRDAFAAAVAGHMVTVTPGGSSANMLVTLGKLLGARVNIHFLGVAGADGYGGMIRRSLADAGIVLLPEALPPGSAPQTAVSYVVMFDGGQRAIATWPGNARELLTPGLIKDAWVKDSDALLVQGSLWYKLGQGFADRLVEMGKHYHKELWLTLPTQPRFTAEDAAHFRQALRQAKLVLGNHEELQRVFGLPPEASLEALQKIISLPQGEGEKIAFITLGGQGAVVVTAQGLQHVPAAPAPRIVNTLGVGDTAYAGFVAGYLSGLPREACAQAGMALAAEKLAVNGPRLENPGAAMAHSCPDISF